MQRQAPLDSTDQLDLAYPRPRRLSTKRFGLSCPSKRRHLWDVKKRRQSEIAPGFARSRRGCGVVRDSVLKRSRVYE